MKGAIQIKCIIIIIIIFQMADAVESVKKNNKVRSVIVCSMVPGIFCAGKVMLRIRVVGKRR